MFSAKEMNLNLERPLDQAFSVRDTPRRHELVQHHHQEESKQILNVGHSSLHRAKSRQPKGGGEEGREAVLFRAMKTKYKETIVFGPKSNKVPENKEVFLN